MMGYPRVPALDDDIYGQLVDQLFGTVGALAAATGGALAMGSAGVFIDGRTHFTWCLAALALACVVRVGVLLAYRRWHGRLDDRATMRRWETLYAAAGIGWMAVIGVDGYCSMMAPDVLLHVFASLMAMGLTGGIAARNASRPWIVKVQIVAVLGPYCCALVEIGGAYLAMVAMSLFMFAGVASATETFHRVLLATMRTAKANTLLATRLDTAMSNMSHGLVMFDAAMNVEVFNAKFAQTLGIPGDRIKVGMSLGAVVEAVLADRERLLRTPEEHVETFSAKMRSRVAGELLVKTARGVVYDFRFHPTVNGGSVISVEDITEKSVAADKIARLAHFDELTDLPNRTLAKDMLAVLVGTGERFAVHFLDLDNFKQVNDTLGHSVGDALLAAASARIKSLLGPEDFCARLAGDEFVVVQKARDPGAPAALATRLVEGVARPFAIEAQEILIGASVGIVTSDAEGASVENLLKFADLALYCAKQNGKGTFCFFQPAMIEAAKERRELEHDLRHALGAGEIGIAFQPIVDVERGTVVSFEALARWHHPQRGSIAPTKFIAIAESTGLIIELGDLILHRACREALAWPDSVTVSVNLSVAQFRHGVVVTQIKEALRASGLPPTRLEVEVTETLASQDVGEIHDLVAEIRSLGVRVALDDFGTGYSSLASLQQIPFDKVKLDRGFVRSLTEDPMSRSLVHLLVSFARGLDKPLVVEGVETEEQVRLLRAFGVAQMQGYFFAKPKREVCLAELAGPLAAAAAMAAPARSTAASV